MGFSGYSLNCSGSEKVLFVRKNERSSEIFSVIDSNWFRAFNVLSRSLLFGNGHPEFDFYYAKMIVRCDFNGTYFVNDSCGSSSIHFPISIIAHPPQYVILNYLFTLTKQSTYKTEGRRAMSMF